MSSAHRIRRLMHLNASNFSRHPEPGTLAVAPRGRGALATGALAVGALALGVVAVGAVALGAVAIGRLAVGRLAVGRARIGRLEVGELSVRRLLVPEGIHTATSMGGEPNTAPVAKQPQTPGGAGSTF